MTSPFPLSMQATCSAVESRSALWLALAINHQGNSNMPRLQLNLPCSCSLSLGILPPSQIQAPAGLLERLSAAEQGTPPPTWLRLPSKNHLTANPCVSSDETAEWRNLQSTPGLINNQNGSYCNSLSLGVKIDNSQSCNITRKKKKAQGIKLYQLIGNNYKTITTNGNWYMWKCNVCYIASVMSNPVRSHGL